MLPPHQNYSIAGRKSQSERIKICLSCVIIMCLQKCSHIYRQIHYIVLNFKMVCSFILAICCTVFSFILVSSAKCFLSCRWGFSLSVVHILPHYGAHSNPLNVQNIRLYICRISGVYYT